MPSGISAFVSFSQPEKAVLPIPRRLPGKLSVLRFLQPANAPFSKPVTPSGTLISVRFPHRLNAPLPTDVTLSGTVYAVSDELHQLFVPGRSCMPADVLLDSAGVLAGTLLCSAVLSCISVSTAGRNS